MASKITYTEATANYIQNFGEQHPDFHNAEMNRWRKRWHRVWDNNICPSSLDENHDPITDETAHKWDDSSNPIACAECGAQKG
jgi:hypothetical protein